MKYKVIGTLPFRCEGKIIDENNIEISFVYENHENKSGMICHQSFFSYIKSLSGEYSFDEVRKQLSSEYHNSKIIFNLEQTKLQVVELEGLERDEIFFLTKKDSSISISSNSIQDFKIKEENCKLFCDNLIENTNEYELFFSSN